MPPKPRLLAALRITPLVLAYAKALAPQNVLKTPALALAKIKQQIAKRRINLAQKRQILALRANPPAKRRKPSNI